MSISYRLSFIVFMHFTNVLICYIISSIEANVKQNHPIVKTEVEKQQILILFINTLNCVLLPLNCSSLRLGS